MKLNIVPTRPLLTEPKQGYVYKNDNGSLWLGIKHYDLAGGRAILVALNQDERNVNGNWWNIRGGGFGSAPHSFVELGKLTVEN